MHVLFVSWRDLAHPNAGGSEIVVDRVARGLQARGHEVTLLCGGPIGERPYRIVENGSTYSQYARAGATYLREFRDADLVVDVVNGMPFFSPLWRHKPRLCVVHHVHGDQWQQYFSAPVAKVGETIEQQVLPRLYRNTHFLSISSSSKEALVGLGLPSERVHLMYNGLALDDIGEHRRSETPMFLALGRLAPNKRLDLLLQIWKRVRPVTGGRLVIAGDGPEQSRLAELAAGDDSVELVGKVSERRKAELLQEAWVLVHTALHEGWGLVIMEAAASGTPSIAFNVSGVRDAVVDGVTGVLAEDEDEFARQWEWLGTDARARANLGDVARARAAEFTWDGAVDDFLKAAEAAMTEHEQLAPQRRALGIGRSVELFKLFRREPVDPDAFYHYLAGDTVRQLKRYLDLRGARAIDIGGGPGYTAEALKAEGTQCCVVEYAHDELLLHERSPDVAVQGDGQALPVATGSVQLAHSSNVLEHVPDPTAMLAEMARVLEPEHGIGYMTFTNWHSPWGGHETSPWHYLGGRRAVRRYEKHHGNPPKNEYGKSLFRLTIADVLRWFEGRDDLEVLWVGPRYLPEWTRSVVRVPGVREVVTWNLVVVFRRRGGAAVEPVR